MTTRILIVEDEPSIVDVLKIALRREGLDDVATAGSVAEAVAAATREPVGVAIIDVGLPDGSGFDLAVKLRELVPDVPMLFLTARDSDSDKLMGFGVGGDDYVTKPFNPLEVVARVRALIRRANPSAAGVRDFGRFQLYPEQGRLVVDGADVQIPAREFQLLAFLAEQPGRVFSAGDIYRAVWGEQPIGSADQNTVSVHVHRLRDRIEPEPSHPAFLVTVRGLGYKLVPPFSDAE